MGNHLVFVLYKKSGANTQHAAPTVKNPPLIIEHHIKNVVSV